MTGKWLDAKLEGKINKVLSGAYEALLNTY
jgi:hypothetical protein